jgi:hypothetical protein
MNLIAAIAPILRFGLGGFTGPVTYVASGGASATLQAFIRGLRSDDLFAAAMQQDSYCEIDAAQFTAAFPARPVPARYDRVRTATVSYAVEAWRGAPNDDAPVFFKLLLRGGSQ